MIELHQNHVSSVRPEAEFLTTLPINNVNVTRRGSESQSHQTVASDVCSSCLKGRYPFVIPVPCGFDTLLTRGDRTLWFWTARACSHRLAKIAFGWHPHRFVTVHFLQPCCKKLSSFWKSESQVNSKDTSKPTEQLLEYGHFSSLTSNSQVDPRPQLE